MKSRKYSFIFIWLLLVAMTAAACGQAGEMSVTETPTSTPTPTPIVSGSGSGGSSDPEPEEPVSPTDIPDEPTATPENDYDACLIGTWGIDKEAFANYLYQALNQNEMIEFTFSEIEGDFEMVIEPGVLNYTSTEPLSLKLSLVASGVTLTTLDMIVIGQGGAYWTTAENYFIQYGQEYNFFGNGLADMINSDLVGQAEVTVVLDPSMFVSMAEFENPAIPVILDLNPDIQNYAVATYTCQGNTFTYHFDEYTAIWHRK